MTLMARIRLSAARRRCEDGPMDGHFKADLWHALEAAVFLGGVREDPRYEHDSEGGWQATAWVTVPAARAEEYLRSISVDGHIDEEVEV